MSKISKVLLINPPQISGGKFIDGYQGTRPVLPPLGLAYIAAYLEKHDYKVDIFDGMVEAASPEEIAARASSYDFVGITSITFQVILAYQVLEAIRQRNPLLPIVIGGPHVSCLPLEPLERGLVDFVVVGEGEQAMLEILQAYESGRDFSKITGVAFRSGDKIFPPSGSGMTKDLNSLPFPARHLLPMKRYRASAVRTRHYPALSMVTSRGCPLRCTFCFNQLTYRRQVRFLSAENIVGEMMQLITEYGAREIHFWDDNFLVNKNRINDFFNIVKSRNLHISFDCEGTINSFDPEILRKMKNIGCYSVSYGIESGTQRMLDLMRKNTTLDKIRRVVEETRSLGLDTRGYFLLGFPTETKDEIMETINFARALKLTDATFSLLIPLPGTEIYEMVKDEPQFMKDYWNKIILSEISFPRVPLVYRPQSIDENELLQLHRMAMKSFYFQPHQLLNKALRCFKSYEVFIESLKGLKSLVST